MRNVLTKGLGISVRDHESDVVAHERNGTSDAQVLVQEAMDVASHGFLVVTAGWSPRVSGATIIGSDDSKTGLDQRRNNMAPLPPRLRESVKEYDSAFPCPCRHVMKSQSRLDLSHAMCPGHVHVAHKSSDSKQVI